MSLLLCAASLFWLAALAPAGPSGRAFTHRGQPKETKKKEVLKAVAKEAPKGDVNDAMAQQFEQQFGPQFRRLCKMELHFMRTVCQPTRPQYEKIAGDAEAAMTETIRKYAAIWHGGVNNDQSDPQTPIADAIAKSVRANLTPDQATRYQKELDQRAAARKRVTLLNLVAAVDNVLVLSAEQRARLGAVLETNWDASWDHPQWLFNLWYYFPPMPDDKIMPLLTENQKAAWRGIPKGAIRFGFNPGAFLPTIEGEDDEWDGDRFRDKRDAAGAGQGAAKAVEK